MILVTGATGNIGSEIVRELRDRGAPVRAFVRDPDKARRRLGEELDVASGDFADPASIRRALDGVKQVLLSVPNGPRQVEHEVNVINAAASAGVGRIVKLSTVGAEIGSPAAFWDWHGRSEQHLRVSAVPAVILRSNFYMSNLLASAEQIRRDARLYAPADQSRIAMIDPRDVGAVAAGVLTGRGHEGQTYVLTGPEAITFGDIASQLSATTGRRVEFVDVPDEAARAGMVAAGMPDWFAESLVTVFVMLRQGAAEQKTDTVERLTGRQPRSFAEFAGDHIRLFGG